MTIFTYHWSFGVDAATSALAGFQTFAQSSIPPELGAEINILGASGGAVDFELIGGYYGSADKFNASIAPYLSTLPTPKTIDIAPGTYIASVKKLGGNLNSSSAPDTHDTFYVKSLMTPQESPMSTKAIKAFFTYAINQATTTVRTTHYIFSSPDGLRYFLRRVGSCSSSSTAGATRRSTPFPWTPLLLRTGARFSPFSSTRSPNPATPRIPATASRFWTVRLCFCN